MCFCFDGQGAVMPHRPDNCRERERAAGLSESPPSTVREEPGRLEAARAAGPVEAAQISN
jgi:hypothetical protein